MIKNVLELIFKIIIYVIPSLTDFSKEMNKVYN